MEHRTGLRKASVFKCLLPIIPLIVSPIFLVLITLESGHKCVSSLNSEQEGGFLLTTQELTFWQLFVLKRQ